jgi:hypothetical protein
MIVARIIRLLRYRIDRHGKVVRDERRLSISKRLQQRASKKVRVIRRGTV